MKRKKGGASKEEIKKSLERDLEYRRMIRPFTNDFRASSSRVPIDEDDE